MRLRSTQIIASTGALLGWSSLILQLGLLIRNIHAQGGTTQLAIWRFLGYFTILSNILVASLLSHAARRPGSTKGLADPRLRLAAATAITMVGIVYSIALRQIWSPQGWQRLADIVLHDVTPLLFLLFFLLTRSRALRALDALYALIFPAAYVVYAFTRGAFDGWYPYHFLDPTQVNSSLLARNAVLLFVAFLIMALLLVGLSRILAPATSHPASARS